MIDYIILEDERFAYEEIKRMITILRPDYHLKAWADGVERAVSVLTDDTPDLLIADIRLSDGLCPGEQRGLPAETHQGERFGKGFGKV